MTTGDVIIKMIEQAKRAAAPVHTKSNLYSDLAFTSLSFIALLLKIESAYSITFDLTEMEMCLEVGQLIALVEGKVGALHSHD